MSKSKTASKGSKSSKSDVLTKVKDAAVAKPTASAKGKSKEIAKSVAVKEEKKSKKSKKVKEPTPEPSESEDSASSESSSEESESEDEAKPAVNGKANGPKKAASGSDSESDSDDSASDDDAPVANGVLGKAAPVTEQSSDESSEEESEDEKSAKKAAVGKTQAKQSKGASDSGSDSDSDSDDSASESEVKADAKAGDDDGSDSSDDSSDEEEDDEKSKITSSKRKAEDAAQPSAKKTKTEESNTSEGANLFVGNLSWNVDEAWLKEVFEEFGEVSRVQVITERDSGRSKGFGYVEFVNAADAAKAHAAKKGADLDNRPLNIDFANARPNTQDRQDNRRKSYGDQLGEPTDTLFLGNLSFDAGQESVSEAFAPHGTILGVRLPTDRDTGNPKGYGYVTFASVDEAKAALDAMQGAYLDGRPVRLDYSQPRPQNDSPARGRGGFGGRGGPRGGARGGARGGRGGRGSFGGRGGRGGGRGGNTTNRGGFGDFSGKKVSFD